MAGKPGRPRKAAKEGPIPPASDLDLAFLESKWADFPGMSVISRRFNDPNDSSQSLPILLVGEESDACANSDHQWKMRIGDSHCRVCKRPNRVWHLRWSNTSILGRFNALRAKGLVPVSIKELQRADDVSDLVRAPADDFVRRGDQGKEILHKIPLEIHLTLRRRFHNRLNGSGRAKMIQNEINEANTRHFGEISQIDGSSVAGAVRVEEFTRSKVDMAEEASKAVAEGRGAGLDS